MTGTIYYLTKKENFTPVLRNYTKLPDNFVRVRHLFCGICGGDYSCFLGRRNQYPYTLGHEFIAEVISTGKDVHSLIPGDMVVSDFNYRCGQCKYCRSGQTHMCRNNNIQNFSNRAFAEFSDIDEKYLYRLQNWGDPLLGTLVEPLSCVLHAFDVCTTHTIPQKILIVGLGNIGMLFAFLLKIIIQIPEVYVIDRIPKKMKSLQNFFGCIAYENSKDLTFDLIIDAANSVSGSHLCLELSAPNQQYCMMSHLYGLETSFIYEAFCQKEITPYFPLRNGTLANIEKACLLVKQYWDPKYNSMIETFPLTEIQQAFIQKDSLSSNKQVIQINC